MSHSTRPSLSSLSPVAHDMSPASSSPSTSVTAVSPAESPRFASSTWAKYADDDEEKLPPPAVSSYRHSRSASIPTLPSLGFGLTRRRRLMTVLAVVGILCTGFVWVNGMPSGLDWVSTIPVLPSPDGGADHLPPDADTSTTNRPESWLDLPPSSPFQKWGADLSSERILTGLSPWPSNPPIPEDQPPLSSLGRLADEVYKVGPLTLPDYAHQLLEFVDVAFPLHLATTLRNDVEAYLRNSLDEVALEGRRAERWDGVKRIWQTDKDESMSDDRNVKSWREGGAVNDGWEWELVSDAKAEKYVKKHLMDSTIATVWHALPTGILRSDMLRYLLLFLEGGIYTDTDTKMLKTPAHWGHGAKLWREGAGWMDDASLQRIQAGERAEVVLGEPSVVVGVEADVGNREDWHDWWPRPMQIVQWTMASAPHHPIALDALLRITHATADAVDWAHDHATEIKHLKESGQSGDLRKLLQTDVLSNPKDGGPIGVMAWTGPGVWTDAVLSYLRVKYGVVWTDLRALEEPLRIGDVVVLPVTGFSPGVGNFGSKPHWHNQAMVEHGFRGSWKSDKDPK